MKQNFLSKWYQELMRDNWGVTAHFFICYFWAFAWTGLSINWSVDLRYAFGFLIGSSTFFVMIVYEKNQYYDKKTKGKFKDYALKDGIQDVIANILGLFVGITSGMGLFYV